MAANLVLIPFLYLCSRHQITLPVDTVSELQCRDSSQRNSAQT